MASRNRYPGIDPRIVACIRHHAVRVRDSVPGMDVEDIEQELMLRVHQRLAQFNPSRSSVRTFTDRIARNCIASLLQAAQAKKRGAGIEVLFSDWMTSHGENVVTGKCDSSDAEPDQLVFCPEPYLNLRIDLWRAYNRLPSTLRSCFLGLFDNTVTDAARRSGVSRAAVYDRIAAIRELFRTIDLQAYATEPDTFEVFSVSEQ
jgi:DNA-directed RNA polymerase specialized sigma24 family protein